MFEIRRLGAENVGLILEMQERIYSELPDKSVFQRSTVEFISYCLGHGGRCYGVQHHGETIAYRMVYFPRNRAFNLAKDVRIPLEEYHRVAQWDTIAVLPEWRGNGLSGLMNTRALADLADTGMRHLLATSSPRNPHGIRSLIKAGFRPIQIKLKFGGKLRLLFYRPFPDGWPDVDPTVIEEVSLSATSELRTAFRGGWVGKDVRIEGSTSKLLIQHCPLEFDI